MELWVVGLCLYFGIGILAVLGVAYWSGKDGDDAGETVCPVAFAIFLWFVAIVGWPFYYAYRLGAKRKQSDKL